MNRPTEPASRLEDIARRLSSLPRDKQDAFVAWLDQRGISVLGLPIVAQPRPAIVPVSSGQRRLWLLDQLHPGSSLYNIPRVFALAGALDVRALARALEALVARHEALRTTFATQDGEPAQVIGPPPAIDLDPIDLTGLPEAARLPRARALADAEAHRPFDLARGPLFRPRLVRVAPELCWLLLTSHHIVMDEWSDAIIARELVELYDAHHRGRAPALPALTVQYADYALWQRRWQADRFDAELAYWRARLGGDHEGLALPGDVEPPAGTPARASDLGASLDFRLDPALTARLRDLSARHNTTLFTTLLAVFHIVLHRYTGKREIRVGSPIANRHRREIEGVVGFFANTQVLTSTVRGERSFSAYLDEMRQTVVEAQAHQDVPFDRLVEVLQPERRASHTPLFQVMFSWHRGLTDHAPGEGALAITQEHVDDRGAKFDLVLHMTDDAAGAGGELLYRAARFSPQMMATMAERFARLCAEVAAHPERRIAALAWLGEAERAQLVSGWNETAAPRPFVALHREIEAIARSQPDAPAVQAGDAQLSYGALDRRAAQLAHALIARGVGLDARVGLALPRSIDLIVALVGIVKAGAAYVPLDARAPGERLREMLADGGIAFVVAHGEAAARFTELGAQVIDLADLAADAPTTAGVDVTRDTAAYVLYTSGSTGRPKGVVIPHGAITSYTHGMLERFALPRGLRMALVSTPTADLGNTVLFGALLSGGVLHVVPEACCFDADGMAAYGKAHAIDVLKITPSHLGGLLQAARPGDVLPRHSLILGGEAASTELLAQVRRHGTCRIRNHYGPTETTVGVLTYDLATRERDALDASRPIRMPLGRPLPRTQAYILDGHLAPVPPGVLGELFIGGDGLARGYLDRPDATAERFIPDPFRPGGGRLYRTGDRARFRADGAIEFAGRVDDQIKLRGHRIEPGEIRQALLRLSGVADAHVALRAEPSPRLVAYLVFTTPDAATQEPARLREALAAWLPEPMLPSDFVWLERFPVTANGKLDRRALPEPGAPVATGAAAPRTPVEATMVEIWKDVLRLETVGIADNFFTLGGESLLAFQVVARLRKAGVVIAISQLFEHQTIERLARVAVEATPHDEAAPAPAEGPVPLTPIQHAFFARALARPAHFNQSVLLTWDGELAIDALEQALAHVVAHHDALRLRFAREGIAWTQAYASELSGEPVPLGCASELPGEPVPDGAASAPRLCAVVALDACETADLPAAIAAVGNRTQRSFDLAHGPLLRAVRFDLGRGRGTRLLVVAHHLVVDGVSWRIVLADLAAAYQAIVAGAAPALPPRTATFQAWATALSEHAMSDELDAEAAYWQDLIDADDAALLSAGDPAGNTVASARSVQIALTEAETTALLTRVPAAYRTRIDDVLLTALAHTLCEWTGRDSVVIQLEGHGRSPRFAHVDVSRTVGWFTATHPIRLTPDGAPGRSLQRIKEQLRAVPDRGIGYGVLRHLAGAVTGDEPALTFNYLGQFDQTFDEAAVFRPAPEPTGDERDPEALRDRWFDVIGMVEGGRLGLEWQYSPALHSEAVVAQLAARYLVHLRQLIAHGTSGARGVTPSDFPLAGLTQPELDALPLPALDQVADIYPVTPIQAGILFHCLMAPGEGLYLTQRVIDLDRTISLEALRAAWQAAVAAHDVLRTGFVFDGLSHPVQVVWRDVAVPFEVVDGRHLAEAERAGELERLLAADRARGFDLARPPLMRITLLQLGPARWQLVWTDHHLLLDGWSCWRILAEVFDGYAAITGGEAVPRRDPGPAFRDYVAWLGARDHAAAEAFWTGELATVEAPTLLAPSLASLPRAGQAEHGFARHEAALPADTTARLQRFAREQSITINTLVQGAVALAIGLYTGRADVIFGVTVAGRPEGLPGAHDMVGLFINTLPLRVGLAPAQPVVGWLRALQRRNAAMREHEHTPLVRAQALSGAPRGGALFDTLLVFENYPIDRNLGAAAEDLGVGAVAALERTNYPVTIEVVPGEQLLIQVDHDRRAVGSQAAAALVRRVARALEVLAASTDATRLADLALLAPDEHHALAGWNATTAPVPPTSVRARFEAQVVRRPDTIAVVDRDRHLTYRALDAQAGRLASRLVDADIGPESLVAIAVERSLEMVIGLVAILKAGAAYLPLDPAYPDDRIAYMLGDARPSVVLAGAAQCATSWARAAGAWNLDEVLAAPVDTAAAAPLPGGTGSPGGSLAHPEGTGSPGSLAYCIYTSGSTGAPKGVAVGHAALGNFLASMAVQLEVGEDDAFLALTSLSFDIAALELWLPLTLGGRVVLAEREEAADAERLIARLRDGSVSVVQATPTTWRTLAREPGAMLGAHCKLLCGGEALPPDLATRLLERAPRVFHVYGPTETTVWSMLHVLDAAHPAPSIGRPLANTAIHLLDSGLRPVPVGVAGELYIGGLGLARGYWQRAALTAERFVPDPFAAAPGARMYRTGDLARRDADGTITCLGRTDDQVKLRGHRIELGEIEARLRAVPSVAQAVVVARAIDGGEPQLVAYVVRAAEAGAPDAFEANLRAALAAVLPEPMRPQRYVFLADLPRTHNGKLDRKALPAPTSGGRTDRVAPRDPIEQALAQLWQRLLTAREIGVRDDFFALGGDSVVALQLVAAARPLGFTLAPRDVFEAPTIEGLAAILRAAGQGAAGALEDRPFVPLVMPAPDAASDMDVAALDGFAVSRLVDLDGDVALDAARLDEAVRAVERHHDALRLRVRDHDGAQVHAIGAPAPGPRVHTFSGDASTSVAHAHAAARRRLSLAHGPLIAATLLAGAGPRARLLVTAHAFAVDAASWPIVLDDLATAYRQLAAGAPPALPAPTSSLRAWLAAGDHTTTRVAAPRLPRAVHVALDPASTTALRSELPAQHRAQADEVLIAALAAALVRWAGPGALWLELESVTRRVERTGIDLTRMVGGCTVPRAIPIAAAASAASTADRAAPAASHATADRAAAHATAVRAADRATIRADQGASATVAIDPGARLLAIKEALRAPASTPGAPPRVRLRDLGDLDAGTVFHASDAELVGATGAELVVSCAVRAGRLTLAVQHTTLPLDATQRLAAELLAELPPAIDRLRAHAPQAAPADFSHVDLDASEVDDLFEDLA